MSKTWSQSHEMLPMNKNRAFSTFSTKALLKSSKHVIETAYNMLHNLPQSWLDEQRISSGIFIWISEEIKIQPGPQIEQVRTWWRTCIKKLWSKINVATNTSMRITSTLIRGTRRRSLFPGNEYKSGIKAVRLPTPDPHSAQNSLYFMLSVR